MWISHLCVHALCDRLPVARWTDNNGNAEMNRSISFDLHGRTILPGGWNALFDVTQVPVLPFQNGPVKSFVSWF